MGFMRDVKADTIRKHAERARSEGRTVFAAMINTPATAPDMTGPVPDWAEVIEAVESAGWQLYHWTVGQDKKGRPQAYPLFRPR